jgi:hypothetical protein
MAVMLDLAPGDTLVVGTGTRIRMVQKSGQRARLAIDSHEDVERIKAGEDVPPLTSKTTAPATPTAATPVTPFLRRATATK